MPTVPNSATCDNLPPGSAPGKTPPAPLQCDPVEVALAAAVTQAAAAGEWAIVAQFGRELEARRKALTADNVVPITTRQRGGTS